MIKIGIAGVSTTFARLSASFAGLLLKYGICHVIFILEMSLLNLLNTIRYKIRGNMKNNLKVLFIQLCVLAIGCFIGEAVFGLPKWLGLVIAGLMFYLVFFIIQIKGTMSSMKDEVSSLCSNENYRTK